MRADGAINAMESFLRSTEVQRLFVNELVQGTRAETGENPQRGRGVRWLIQQELLDDSNGDFERARSCAAEDLNEVEHLLHNHAEAVG